MGSQGFVVTSRPDGQGRDEMIAQKMTCRRDPTTHISLDNGKHGQETQITLMFSQNGGYHFQTRHWAFEPWNSRVTPKCN